MEGFLDLANLYQQIKNEIGAMSYAEMELPETFKSNVTSIGDRNITYHKYTAIASKMRADSIIIPNFWFYLAVKIKNLPSINSKNNHNIAMVQIFAIHKERFYNILYYSSFINYQFLR